jgi:hypothetical protein
MVIEMLLLAVLILTMMFFASCKKNSKLLQHNNEGWDLNATARENLKIIFHAANRAVMEAETGPGTMTCRWCGGPHCTHASNCPIPHLSEISLAAGIGDRVSLEALREYGDGKPEKEG